LTEKTAFSPPNTFFLPELIFFAAGLDPGNHSVTLISTTDEVFTVDYAVVDKEMNPNLLASSSSTMSPSASNTAPTTTNNSTPPPPACVTFALLLMVFLNLLLQQC
jgi:hypothetical protein